MSSGRCTAKGMTVPGPAGLPVKVRFESHQVWTRGPGETTWSKVGHVSKLPTGQAELVVAVRGVPPTEFDRPPKGNWFSAGGSYRRNVFERSAAALCAPETYAAAKALDNHIRLLTDAKFRKATTDPDPDVQLEVDRNRATPPKVLEALATYPGIDRVAGDPVTVPTRRQVALTPLPILKAELVVASLTGTQMCAAYDMSKTWAGTVAELCTTVASLQLPTVGLVPSSSSQP